MDASWRDERSKWRRLLKEDAAGCNFDLDKLAPGRFVVLYNSGGQSGACYSELQVVGVFDDARDFLGFLRFAEIPRILDFDTGTLREPFPDHADAYLLKYEGDEREKIDHLIGIVDRSLASETIPTSQLCVIRDVFNSIFSSTNPQVEIVAWGSLAGILRSDAIREAFEEGVEEERDEKPSTELKALLDAGEFAENNEEHLAVARLFLNSQLRA